MKKNILSIVVIVLVLLVGAGAFALRYNSGGAAATHSPAASATPVQPQTITYKGQDGKTALTLLGQHATIKTSGSGANAFVTSVDGYTASSSKHEYWSFLVNGQLASVGAGSYVTKSTDTITWKIDHY
ncbi:DUF4430 domain-containing protein [Patescibacteria group bacterium]|nr:DUF4430 domain-containing protein [Patescibacteria group bacterium]